MKCKNKALYRYTFPGTTEEKNCCQEHAEIVFDAGWAMNEKVPFVQLSPTEQKTTDCDHQAVNDD